MAKLSTLKATATPSVMLFGAPFTGKSLLAGKLAEHFNIIYIDIEGGHDVLFQLPELWQERIEVVSIPDTTTYPMAIETCLKIVKGPVDVCEAHGKVSCMVCKRNKAPTIHVDLHALSQDTIVIFDSATQLTSSAISNITKAQPDDYKLEYDDWGSLAKLMDIFFSHIQTARYNRIVISHTTEAKQDDGRTLIFPVAGSRNFSSNVAKFFDHVVYLEKKNKKHKAASATTYMNNIMTGSRSGVVMEEMEESSLLSIFAPDKVSVPSAASAISKTAISKTATTKTLTSSSAKAGSSTNISATLARLKSKL